MHCADVVVATSKTITTGDDGNRLPQGAATRTFSERLRRWATPRQTPLWTWVVETLVPS